MTPSKPNPVEEMPETITTDDLKHKALAIREMATVEARKALEDNTVRLVIASALIFGVAISVAYFMGSRSARAAEGRRR